MEADCWLYWAAVSRWTRKAEKNMTEDLEQIEQELKELSREIALFKREFNSLSDGPEKEMLRCKFKDKQ